MLILASKIISVLKANAALVAYIGSNANIFPSNSGTKKDKYIVVSTEVGEDGNNIPVMTGDLYVEAVCRRDVANAESVCLAIIKMVDDILNQGELVLTDSTYRVRHFIRISSSGLEVDLESNEYYYRINYQYIVEN
jgi:hypothetical protein